MIDSSRGVKVVASLDLNSVIQKTWCTGSIYFELENVYVRVLELFLTSTSNNRAVHGQMLSSGSWLKTRIFVKLPEVGLNRSKLVCIQ